jgi:ABC-type multidrug transport system fused ATPase/permease subunit
MSKSPKRKNISALVIAVALLGAGLATAGFISSSHFKYQAEVCNTFPMMFNNSLTSSLIHCMVPGVLYVMGKFMFYGGVVFLGLALLLVILWFADYLTNRQAGRQALKATEESDSRTCPNNHLVPPRDSFCSICGAAIDD